MDTGRGAYTVRSHRGTHPKNRGKRPYLAGFSGAARAPHKMGAPKRTQLADGASIREGRVETLFRDVAGTAIDECGVVNNYSGCSVCVGAWGLRPSGDRVFEEGSGAPYLAYGPGMSIVREFIDA